ncbi:solute carrier family 17 member 9 [Orussus abietinus]|uniref:solute carrier family 17 member 9 n=1 Tax=Orussus abietinus TaxID=222816 RepID=UPI0006252154|nr:solute carrier family 17 member 9 [Orussus abietinus]
MALSADDMTCLFWSRKERRRWFILLLCGTCLVYATRTSVPLLMPTIIEENHWSKTDSGIFLSSFFWGYTLTQVAGGYISDRIGGQKVMWISALGWSFITCLMPIIMKLLSDSDFVIQLLALVRTINGAFQGMHFPSMISLTSQRLHESERASFFSLLTAGSALGILLTGSLGSYILENYDWTVVFKVLGGLSLLWTGCLSYYCTSLKGTTISTNKSSNNHSLPWSELLSKPPFWSCVIGHACQNNCFFVILSWMPMYFHETYPEAKGWIVNMLPWIPSLPCTYLGKILSEKLIKAGYTITVTRKIVQTICFMTQSINLLFLARAETFQGALLCFTLIIGGSGFHNTAIVVNPADLAPKYAGSVFGLMNTVGAIPGSLGVYFAGYILHTTHSWPIVFIVTSMIETLGCIIYLWFGSGNSII